MERIIKTIMNNHADDSHVSVSRAIWKRAEKMASDLDKDISLQSNAAHSCQRYMCVSVCFCDEKLSHKYTNIKWNKRE